mgnify:CR=1 FL=1
MAKTIVKPWVKVFGVIVVVAAIVFGLYSLGQSGDGKNFSFGEYIHATAFEALLGYLYLSEQKERLYYFLNRSLEELSYR